MGVERVVPSDAGLIVPGDAGLIVSCGGIQQDRGGSSAGHVSVIRLETEKPGGNATIGVARSPGAI